MDGDHDDADEDDDNGDDDNGDDDKGEKMMMIHMMVRASFNRETFTVEQLYGNAANKCEHALSHWNTSARRRKKYFVTLKYFIRIFLLHILCEHAFMPIYFSKTGENAI